MSYHSHGPLLSYRILTFSAISSISRIFNSSCFVDVRSDWTASLACVLDDCVYNYSDIQHTNTFQIHVMCIIGQMILYMWKYSKNPRPLGICTIPNDVGLVGRVPTRPKAEGFLFLSHSYAGSGSFQLWGIRTIPHTACST